MITNDIKKTFIKTKDEKYSYMDKRQIQYPSFDEIRLLKYNNSVYLRIENLMYVPSDGELGHFSKACDIEELALKDIELNDLIVRRFKAEREEDFNETINLDVVFKCVKKDNEKAIFLCDEIMNCTHTFCETMSKKPNEYKGSDLEKYVLSLGKDLLIPSANEIEEWFPREKARVIPNSNNEIRYWTRTPAIKKDNVYAIDGFGKLIESHVAWDYDIRPYFIIK